MKKSIIIGVSILSIFILCSLSYQPIIADTPIEPIPIAKKSKASDLDVDELKELYIKLLELKSQSKDDCGCNNEESSLWNFPIICTLIFPLYLFIIILWGLTGIHDLFILWTEIEAIGIELGCWWT